MTVTHLPDVVPYDTKFVYDIKTSRTKQDKPYLIATNYKRVRQTCGLGTGPYASFSCRSVPHFLSNADLSRRRTFAHNKAYDRFVSKLGDTSSFGATVTAERREAFGMITMFAVQILRAGLCAKRGDFLGVLHNLGFNPPLKQVKRVYPRKRGRRKRVVVTQEVYAMPDRRMVIKRAASSWLLWSYGVQPLLSDIQNATEVFVRDYPSTKVHASATERYNVSETFGSTGVQSQYTRTSTSGSLRVSINSDVKITNYDVYLATQLGLTNPVQWLNEAVPFSFVIDWFSNWSSVINALSDFGGLTLSNSCHSTKGNHEVEYNQYVNEPPVKHIGSFSGESTVFVRQIGMRYPSLVFRYERFQWQRALNAISLLVGFLPKSSQK